MNGIVDQGPEIAAAAATAGGGVVGRPFSGPRLILLEAVDEVVRLDGVAVGERVAGRRRCRSARARCRASGSRSSDAERLGREALADAVAPVQPPQVEIEQQPPVVAALAQRRRLEHGSSAGGRAGRCGTARLTTSWLSGRLVAATTRTFDCARHRRRAERLELRRSRARAAASPARSCAGRRSRRGR